jgi:hypothetical protein
MNTELDIKIAKEIYKIDTGIIPEYSSDLKLAIELLQKVRLNIPTRDLSTDPETLANDAYFYWKENHKPRKIVYSVMSPSGRIGDFWLPYEKALEEFNKPYDFPNWSGEHVAYYFESGNIKKSGGVSDKVFLTDCKPQKMYKIGYKDTNYYISPDKEAVEQERINAKENDCEDELVIEEITISFFELELLPEFQGF